MGAQGTSLRTFLVVPAVLFFIIAGSVSWYQRDAAADEARRSARLDASFAASIAADELDVGIKQVIAQVSETAANPGIATVFTASENCTLSFSASAPLTSGHLDIVASDGAVLCSSLAGAGGPGYVGAAWLAAALRAPVLRSVVTDARTGRNALVVASPIDNRGVLATFVDLDSIGPGLATSFGGPGELEFVVKTADGKTTVTRSVSPREWRSRFYGSAPVGTTTWRVFAGASKADALRAAYTVSNRQFVAVLAALVVALIILWFLYRGLARPIANLRDGVREATADLSAEPIDIAGPREVAQLVSDFNQLIEAARREREATARMHGLELELHRAERVDEQERELRLLADRERIGRDLHDTVIQRLFATGMALESVTGRIDDENVKARLGNAVDDIDATIREVRAAIFDMERVGQATPRGLVADLVGRAHETLGFTPSLAFEGPIDTAIPTHVVDQMMAALREALSNVARHASARAVHVAVRVGESIVLEVRDDGVGVNEALVAGGGGLGVASMRARAERLGGQFRLECASEGGTRMEWRVPRLEHS